jgi:MoaA/NifB/PqqE/SkfB family radical SAM enzyme
MSARTIKVPRTLRHELAAIGLHPKDLVLYINSACNLRCKHCYIGNDLLNKSMVYSPSALLEFVMELGFLDRVTVLGGEPLLHPAINRILAALIELPIDQLRVTTNLTGLFHLNLDGLDPSRLTFSVSLDGHNAAKHDLVRGRLAFGRTVANVTNLVRSGWDVEVCHTVMRHNVDTFLELVRLCAKIGVKKLNLHKMSLHGNALGNEHLLVSPERWVQLCTLLEAMHGKEEWGLEVRYPPLFVTEAEYERLMRDGLYHHHAAKSFYVSADVGHRIVLYPDGKVFVSSEAFGTDSYVGEIVDGGFQLNRHASNELRIFSEAADPSVSLMAEQQVGSGSYTRVLSVSYKRVVII